MSTDGNNLTPQNAGYYEGVTDVYYALMTSPDLMNADPEYGTPKVAGKSIEISVTPNYKENKVYASNVATRREQVVDSYSVQLNLDQIIPERRAELLGRLTGDDGVEVVTGKRIAPLVAILYAATLDDGTQEYRTLYKGRFGEPTNTHHTRNDGDSYQHPVITGVFTPLDGSGLLSSVRGGEYVEGQNLLDGRTDIGYLNPQGLSTIPPIAKVYNLTETGQELTTGDTEHSYTLSFKYRTAGIGGADQPSDIAGSFGPFMTTPAGSVSIGDDITLDGPMTEYADFEATFTLTAAQAAAGTRSISFSGGNLAPSTGWQIELKDVKLELGDDATEWAPAPEAWFTYVYQPE